MDNHVCIKGDVIENLRIEVAVAKSNIAEVKNEIKDIKDSIGKLYWWLIGILGSSVLSLALLVFNIIQDR